MEITDTLASVPKVAAGTGAGDVRNRETLYISCAKVPRKFLTI